MDQIPDINRCPVNSNTIGNYDQHGFEADIAFLHPKELALPALITQTDVKSIAGSGGQTKDNDPPVAIDVNCTSKGKDDHIFQTDNVLRHFGSDIRNQTTTPEPVMVYPWSRRIESHLVYMSSMCQRKSDMHEAATHHYDWWNTAWVLPGILIPVIFSPLIPILKSKDDGTCNQTSLADVLTVVGFIATSIVNGISHFFSFGERCTNHSKFSGRYSDLVMEIDSACLAPKKFRQAPDGFLTSLRIRYAHLVFSEPLIPLRIERAHTGRPLSPGFVSEPCAEEL